MYILVSLRSDVVRLFQSTIAKISAIFDHLKELMIFQGFQILPASYA